jgi:tRNA A37 threonylcarbamoyladenosine synthetase subunit TsaC/SUA5/YrdC
MESGVIEVALVPLTRIETAGRPSTIVDVGSDPPRLLRDGAVPADRIREVIGELIEGSG